ncbi:MAG: sporulation protein YqfD [Clostridiales bacterium]|jgi:similar to stage IV sporulation protein|nr:sporulation protein YqfD [Clostridiales bacterium]
MFTRLYRKLTGFAVIKISGFASARFLTLAARKGVILWDVTESGGELTAKIPAASFGRLRACARKTGCRVRLAEKRGLPFFARRFRKRPVLTAGVLFFIAFLYFLSSFIWLVRVEGNARIRSDEIAAFFASENIRAGAPKALSRKKNAEKRFLSAFPEAAWVNVTLKGTTALIRVAEKLPEPPAADKSAPCDIIAAKDGVIVSMVTSAGAPLKQERDAVRRGELLVSGTLKTPLENGGELKTTTRAQAAVTARTYYDFNFFAPAAARRKVFTGKAKKRRDVSVLGKKLNPFSVKIPFAGYDKITVRRQLRLSEYYPLPVILFSEEYREFIYNEETLSPAENILLAHRMLNNIILQNFGFETDIINKRLEFSQTPGGLSVTARVTALERIDMESPLNNGLPEY